MVKLIKMTIKNTKATVKTGKEDTEEFTFNYGVAQGDTLSATIL